MSLSTKQVQKNKKNASPNPVQNVTDNALKEIQLNKEIAWCVDKLRMGVFTKNPTEKQVDDSSRYIKILISQKAPLIKKRQVMRQVFGDYKTKMEREEKKWENDTIKMMKQVQISPATTTHSKESNKFIRTAVSKPISKSEKNIQNVNDLSKTIENSAQNKFCFNFAIDEE